MNRDEMTTREIDVQALAPWEQDTKPMAPELRRHTRYRVPVSGAITAGVYTDQGHAARVRDVSAGGVCVELDAPLSPQSGEDVRVFLLGRSANRGVFRLARIAHSRAMDDGRGWVYGLAFAEVNGPELQSWINDHATGGRA